MGARLRVTLLTAVLAGSPVLGQVQIVERQAPAARTFPEFVGSWVLDAGASTGRMNMAPPPAVRLTIATTPTEITVTKVLDLPPAQRGGGKRMATNNPPPEVYPMNGAPTYQAQYVGGPQVQYTFSLVADALALTQRTINSIADPKTFQTGPHTGVTDALSVSNEVLTLHRQLTSINGKGEILVMSTPAGNLRQTYVYRRAPAQAAE